MIVQCEKQVGCFVERIFLTLEDVVLFLRKIAFVCVVVVALCETSEKYLGDEESEGDIDISSVRTFLFCQQQVVL